VRNAEPWVKDAISSILGQTYKQLELIIIDNNSTDRSRSIIQQFRDDRIILLSESTGHLVAALNSGLRHAKGSLIARQDADDYSSAQRIEQQVSLLRRHGDVGIVGCGFRLISLQGHLLNIKSALTNPEDIRTRLREAMPFAGPSIVGHKTLFDALGGYDTEFDGRVGEDYDLLVRAAEITNITAVNQPLYTYRTNNPLSMCGLINYSYEDAKTMVRRRAMARGSRIFSAS
jgi:glycosyltransferase involved in cell wall biosynthesis